MTDSLDSKTDGELNELFAMEVAGWMRSEERACDWWIHGAGLAQGEPLVFCTDANAVLPWLEKFGHDWDSRGTGRMRDGKEVPVYVIRIILLGTYHYGEAPTFPRAAVIALLRAKRASK